MAYPRQERWRRLAWWQKAAVCCYQPTLFCSLMFSVAAKGAEIAILKGLTTAGSPSLMEWSAPLLQRTLSGHNER